MKRKINIWVILIVLSGIGSLVAYYYLPSTVPLQWKLDGSVSNNGSSLTLLLLALIPVILYWYGIRKPEEARYRSHHITWRFLVIVVICFQWVSICAGFGVLLNIKLITSLGGGITLLITGNYLPSIEPNFWIGIRLPWIMCNKQVWKKTHQVGGYIVCMLGLVMIMNGILWNNKFLSIITPHIIVGGLIAVMLYSLFIYIKVMKIQHKGE